MEERKVEFKKAKTVAALNIVSIALLVLSIVVFMVCLELQLFIDVDPDFGQGLGYAIVLVLCLPCILVTSAINFGADIYKVVFGAILIKANAKAKENQEIEISRRHFKAAKALGIINIIMLLLTAFFAYVIVDAAGNTIFDILFALWFILLAVVELVTVILVGKAKKEIEQYEPKKEQNEQVEDVTIEQDVVTE